MFRSSERKLINFSFKTINWGPYYKNEYEVLPSWKNQEFKKKLWYCLTCPTASDIMILEFGLIFGDSVSIFGIKCGKFFDASSGVFAINCWFRPPILSSFAYFCFSDNFSHFGVVETGNLLWKGFEGAPGVEVSGTRNGI